VLGPLVAPQAVRLVPGHTTSQGQLYQINWLIEPRGLLLDKKYMLNVALKYRLVKLTFLVKIFYNLFTLKIHKP
jgi:hypothetical protein